MAPAARTELPVFIIPRRFTFMRPEFTASLMCMDFLDIKHQIEVLDEELDGYHIDIMDGHYCKNITLSPDFMKACARVAKKPMDVHLMTTNPNDWIDACAIFSSISSMKGWPA